MKKATLSRTSDNGLQTLGSMVTGAWSCKTLELPWKGNQHNISCVPAGIYPVKWTRSNRLSTKAGHDVFTYEVLNVPDRSGIRIHSVNFVKDLLGCIALGGGYSDINSDGHMDLINSRIAVQQFEEAMNREDFELTIIDVPLNV